MCLLGKSCATLLAAHTYEYIVLYEPTQNTKEVPKLIY